MTIYSLFDEISELLAKLEPKKISTLKADAEMQKRLDFLIEKSKEGELNRLEKDELDHYIVLERLIRLAKIRINSQTLAA